jgi:VanZ family protein
MTKRDLMPDHLRVRNWLTVLKRWLPAIVWAGAIYYFSTHRFSHSNSSHWLGALFSWFLPGTQPDILEGFNLMVRKLGHWGEYFIFSLLLLRALRKEHEREWNRRAAAWTLAIVLLYAAGDELHQAFVPNREPHVTDVLLDFFGGVCGVVWMYAREKRSRIA